jgi:hypothetical protein
VNDRDYQRERRKQWRAEQFPPGAQCIICPERDPRCFEWHHVAGHTFGDEQVVVCRNCHRKLSDKQKDHPPIGDGEPTRAECLGRQLLGIADLMELLKNPGELIGLVRRAGLDLIEHRLDQSNDGANR